MLVTILVGCSQPTVKTQFLKPAKTHQATQLRTVAVYDFSGINGKQIGRDLEAELAQIRVNDLPFFTLIERDKIHQIVKEIKRGYDFYFDQDQAVEVGKLIGAEGIYMGHVNSENVVDSNYRETRRKCVEYDDDKKCKKYQEYKVTCILRKAIFSFTPKLVEIKTGKIVYAKTIQETKEVKRCEKKPMPLKQELITSLRKRAINQMEKDIAPHYTTENIQLSDKVRGLKRRQRKQFKSAMDFANNNRMDRACEIWRGLGNEVETFSVFYNMGVCDEVDGLLKKAKQSYSRADRILDKPNDMINDALKRINIKIEAQKKLRDQF